MSPTVSPPVETVDVAVVDMALKLLKVGVDVATTRPSTFVERIELVVAPERVSAPVESAVIEARSAVRLVAWMPVLEMLPPVIRGLEMAVL